MVYGSLGVQAAAQEFDELDLVKGSKCKTFQNVNVCNALTAKILNITGNSTFSNLNVNGQVTLSNSFPQIALANGGNLLDYGSFSFTGETTIAAGAAAILSDTPVTSAGISIGADNQTITIANAGIYLLNGYMVGEALDDASTGFAFAFTNPTMASIPFSGGVQTNGVITTIFGTAIVALSAGQTMQLINAAAGDFSLFDADVPGGARTVGLTIVRLR